MTFNSNSTNRNISVVQLLPALDSGGVERGTLEIAKELVKHGHRSIVISAGGQMVDELINSGSEHVQLDIGRKSLFSLRHIAFLRKYFEQENIDVVHARSRLPAWLTYLAWKKMDAYCRPRFITTVHGCYSVNRYSEVMTKGQSVIAISEFILKYITDNYSTVDKNKIAIVHRGVSEVEFPFAFKADEKWLKLWHEQHSILANKLVLTLPGRVTRRKGHEDFLDVLHHLKRQNIPVHGLILGGAEQQKKAYLKELKNKARSLCLEKEITFLGHRNDVREIMSVSNIVLSLSKEPEAFGRTALESLCLGTPVIAYDHGGAAEILARMYPHGCVKPHDIQAVSDKIRSFYKQPVRVSNKNCFPLEKMLNDTLALYTKAF